MASKINTDNVSSSEHFCMMPWIHIHFLPDSSAHYCCVADSSKPIAKYEGELAKIYNAENIRAVRRAMLEDQPSAECSRCYQLEKNKIYSLRQSVNTKFLKNFDDVEKTQPDGSVDKFTMRYLDIRFSNKCNLRCRSCGPMFSSSWYNDQIKIYNGWGASDKALSEIGPKDVFWKDLLPSLSHVEEAYFAGGEPLVTDEVYDIMDHWLETNNTNIEIGFTTNFTNLNYKSKSITDYWKKFPRLIVSASLDDSGERAEYLRKGTSWAKIVENRKKMLELCPDVKFEITPTISVFNVWHFPEFHFEWLKNGYLTHSDLRLNILTAPSSMAFSIIRPDRRKQIIERWTEYLAKIIDECSIDVRWFNKTVSAYSSVIHALRTEPYADLRAEFFDRNNLVDACREESLYAAYPELKELLAE